MQRRNNTLIGLGITAAIFLLPFLLFIKIVWLSYFMGINILLAFLIGIFLLLFLLILCLEILLKVIFLKILKPSTFHQIEINQDRDLPPEELVIFEKYESELKDIGFIKIIDYTISSVEGFTRLFKHPQHSCFAELSYTKEHSIFCSLVGAYEQNWTLCVNNVQANPNLLAVNYAFLRLPQDLSKILDEEPEYLLGTFLTWNQEITERLGIVILNDMNVTQYFNLCNSQRAKQRKSLSKKSIVICLIEMYLFKKNPKYEWLGDYRKLR